MRVNDAPNMPPDRLHRGAPIGRSDCTAPPYGLFNNLHTTWTSWMRDSRLARARLIVPKGYLRGKGPGQGATFDDDAEVAAALKIPANEGDRSLSHSSASRHRASDDVRGDHPSGRPGSR